MTRALQIHSSDHVATLLEAAEAGEGIDGTAIVTRVDIPKGHKVALRDIAAGEDPVAAERGQAGHDVDLRIRIGIGAGRVVDADAGLARRRLEVDLAHGDADAAPRFRGDMNLAAATDGAGGDGDFSAGGNVGHMRSPDDG